MKDGRVIDDGLMTSGAAGAYATSVTES